MKPKNTHRHLLAALGFATIALSSASAQTTYTWANSNIPATPTATLNWFGATQGTWTGGTPVSSNLNTIQFFQDTTTAMANTGNPSTQISNIDNGGVAFQLATLTLNGRGSATTNRPLTMTISGNALNFSAATGTINLNGLIGTGTSNITYNVNSNIQLGTAGSASALTFAGNGTNVFNFGGNISQLQTGGGSVIKSGSSTVTLSGNNTYTGGTSISGGTIIAGHASALGGGTVTMAANTALLFNTSVTFANNISMGSGSTIAPTQNVTPITYSGTITANGTNSGTSGIAIPSTSIAFSAFSGGDTQTFDNAIGGTGDVAFRGGGANAAHNHNYILKGGASTYTGNTWLYTSSVLPNVSNAGNVVLQLQGGALPSTTVLTMTQNNGNGILNNSVLDLNGNNQTLAGLTTFTINTGGRGWFVSNTHASTASTLTINNTGNFTFAGVIGVNSTTATTGQTAGTNNIALVKQGAGIQTLSGANTYTGKTTISGGTLQFASQTSLYNNTPASWTAANIVVGNTGTLALNVGGANEFTTGNVTTLLTNLGGAFGTSTTGFEAGSRIGFDTTNAAGGTFTVADNIANSSGSGGGAIGLTKLGTNTLALSGTNTYSGGSTITTGTLSFRNTNAKSGTGIHAFDAGTTLGLGVATSGSFYSSTDVNNAFAGTMSGNLSGITVNSTTNVGIDTSAGDFTYGTSVAGSPTRGLAKLGSNTLTLTGTNTYTGVTTISAGVLQIGAGGTTGTLGSGTVLNNAALVINRNDFFTVSNVISGSGSVRINAVTAGNLIDIGGINSYSGGTRHRRRHPSPPHGPRRRLWCHAWQRHGHSRQRSQLRNLGTLCEIVHQQYRPQRRDRSRRAACPEPGRRQRLSHAEWHCHPQRHQ